MDFFKFTADPFTDLEQGEFFRGYDSAMWVERYRAPGEFEIVAPLSSGLRTVLPLGTIISHTDTLEACVVENHNIKEGKNTDPTITITGRSVESYLENRIVGLELAWNDPDEPYARYNLTAATVAQQAKKLINDHIQVSFLNDGSNSFDDNILAEAIAGSGVTEAREIKRQDVHKALLDLLKVEDLGVRFVRKNNFGVMGVSDKSWVYIHAGTDKSSTVVFSWDQGEIQSAEYLSSLKNLKNTALVTGAHLEEIVYAADTNWTRRVMLVEAADIDESYTPPIAAPDRTALRAKMAVRGREALAAQKLIDIVSIDITSATEHIYRKDYDIGDIVSVSGNYDTTVKRRVVEHVEIEDKNGSNSYPSLAALEE